MARTYIWVHCSGDVRPWVILRPNSEEVFRFVEADREYMFEVLDRLNHPDLIENDGDPDELAILYSE